MNRRHLLGAAAFLPLPAVAEAVAPLPTPRQIVDLFAATLSAHDMDAFAALFADTYVNHQTSASAPPPPAGLSQKAGSVAFFAARLKGLPDLHVAIEVALAEGDKVAASFVYTGTQTGPYLGVAPTGRTLRFTSCDIFRIEDGRIAEHWGMGDAAGIMAQLKG